MRNLQNDFKNSILHKHPEKKPTVLDSENTTVVDASIYENGLITPHKNNQISILDTLITENGFTTQQRLQIYHNNFVITLTETLHSLYPTIHQLVGEEFFTGLAHEYIARHIPTAGDLHSYGNQFTEFLTDFPPTRALPYLPEVARLEWAYHEVFHEAGYELLDLNRLQMVSEENYCNIQFKLHPSCRLFDFQYPILSIWQMCQNENNDNENINLNDGGEKILVIRRQLEITFERLSAGEFALLSAFSIGANFEAACSLVLQAEPKFNINVILQKHLFGGTIVDFEE